MQICKNIFFQWHSSNNMGIATPAEFESQIPRVTWNSEFFPSDFWLSLLFLDRKECDIMYKYGGKAGFL